MNLKKAFSELSKALPSDITFKIELAIWRVPDRDMLVEYLIWDGFNHHKSASLTYAVEMCLKANKAEVKS